MRKVNKIKRNLFSLLVLFGLTVFGSAYSEVTTTYYHTDVLGSVVAASDEAGGLLWRKSYSPYGEKVADGEGNDNAISFTGKKHDDTTGLTYFGARYYDPEVGRFMGMDAVGFQDDNPISYNRYAYANNNPYRYSDPDGNVPILIPVVIFIAKELAGEAFERTTGVPAVFSVKGAAKLGVKGVRALGKKGGKSVDEVAKSEKPRMRVKDVSDPGAKQSNYEVNWTKQQFENHLTDNGFSKNTIPAKKGPISIFSKNGNKEFTTRDFAKSTDGPTGEMFKGGEKSAKIRFKRNTKRDE